MNEERNIGVEFIYVIMTTTVMIMSYLLLFIDSEVYISTLLFILPCANEAAKSLAVGKHKIGKRLIAINWLSLVASALVIAACLMGAQLKLEIVTPIKPITRILASVHIFRNMAYVLYFWREL